MFDVYAVHLYGVAVSSAEHDLRPVFDEYGDIFEVCFIIENKDYGNLPAGFPEIAKDVTVQCGPEDIIYIGYDAIMPYEKPVKSKAEMDASISALVTYLYGDAVDKACKHREYRNVWEE